MSTQLLKTGQAWKVVTADTLTLLPTLLGNSVDAVVCDPPYGIDFQDQAWDGRSIRHAAQEANGGPLTPGQAFECWTEIWARELLRVVKPGGYIACFAAPRMTHRLTSGLENSGLEIRDVLMWLYGQGMPKSRRLPGGRGTALKPAYEPVVLARVPLHGTTNTTLQTWGTGALNTQAAAIKTDDQAAGEREGRWPANVALDHHDQCEPAGCSPGCPVAGLERQHAGASRFFYGPKASRRERDAGCEQLPARVLDLFPQAKGLRGPPPRAVHNPHPTVKPIALMRWLTALVTPVGGLVLDPFCGSGSTGCAAVLEDRRFIGVERDDGHAAVARARIDHWATRTHTSPAARQRRRGGCGGRRPQPAGTRARGPA